MVNSIRVNYVINFMINKNICQFENYIKNVFRNNDLNYIDYTINSYDNNLVNVFVEKEGMNYILKCDNKIFNNINDVIKYKHIFPKLYKNNLNLNLYKKELVKLEHKKSDLWSSIVKKYNRIFKKNFKVNNGLNDIYEWYTGAVFFTDYEWEEICNNKIKDLFETMDNCSYIYSLPLDNGIILRGSDIYYYFSTDVSRFKKPNSKEINKWFNNVSIYIKKVLPILDSYQIKHNYDKRLLLALIDNIRNIILILTNCELMNLSNSGQDFIYHSTCKNREINNCFNLINKYQELLETICLDGKCTKEEIDNIKTIYERTLKLIGKINSIISNIHDEFILSKSFNPLREIDNYFENYIVCKYIVDKKFSNYDIDKEINLIGILYGGLELPFIINRIMLNHNTISFLFQNHGMYLDRQQKDKNEIIVNLSEYGFLNKENDTFLIDDNMMSGITMQFAYNQLYLNGINNIKGIIVIRHPNVNRLAQLEYFDTALNLSLVDNYIYGMLTDTPYTKIKSGTNYNNMFVNELNIFSIMTEVFLKALYCNNSFIKDSQVDIFLGYSEGRDGKI